MEHFGNRTRCHERRHSVDIRRKGPIRGDFRRSRPYSVVCFLCKLAGLQRRKKIDALASAKQLDRESVAKIVHHPLQPSRPAHPHGNVIFLIA